MKTSSWIYFIVGFTLIGCKQSNTAHPALVQKSCVTYAQNFDIQYFDDFSILTIYTPQTAQTQKKEFYLFQKNKKIPDSLQHQNIIRVPIQKIVATSTAHIPMLEALKAEKYLVGFPNTSYISSEKTYNRIAAGQVTELGNEQEMNMELLLTLQPEVVILTAQENTLKWKNRLQKIPIQLLENSDWLEKHPLGRAEWIKVFGLLFNQSAQADSLFLGISNRYNELKKSASTIQHKPTVMSGSLFQDIWYTPSGESFLAQLIADANGQYIWSDTKGTGSLSLSPESVLVKAQHTDFWIAPGDVTTYYQLQQQHKLYQNFDPFRLKKIYTYAFLKGKNGGLLYFETSPLHPEWVLEDCIRIFHPELIFTDTTFRYFAPLQ